MQREEGEATSKVAPRAIAAFFSLQASMRGPVARCTIAVSMTSDERETGDFRKRDDCVGDGAGHYGSAKAASNQTNKNYYVMFKNRTMPADTSATQTLSLFIAIS